jgi:hypothetical protein
MPAQRRRWLLALLALAFVAGGLVECGDVRTGGAATLAVPAGRHRPPLGARLWGRMAGVYGFTTARTLRWRVTVRRPARPHGLGGKLVGATRTLGWPFGRLRYGDWSALVKPAHEASDRFGFGCTGRGVHVFVYAYRAGRRPYDDAARFPDQRQPLATLPYDAPHTLSLTRADTLTTYRVRDATGALVATRTVRHRPTPGWRLGRLLGPYVGGTTPAPRRLTLEVTRVE